MLFCELEAVMFYVVAGEKRLDKLSAVTTVKEQSH